LRGAANAVAALGSQERQRGIVAVSTGNHGRGLAWAARQAGVRCVICMSTRVPQNKLDAIASLGAEVRVTGNSQEEAQVEADRLIAEEGMSMVPPFDHPQVIAGQGTLGLDMIEQLPEVKTVLIPLSGGGLISGVATAIKANRPGVHLVGVSMERGAAMYQCQKAGKPIVVEELDTLADALAGGIGLNNQYTFQIVKNLVDDIVLVSEAEISAAVRHIYWHEQQVVEGSGSVGVAALLGRKVQPTGPTIALLSGGNIDMHLHRRIVSGEHAVVR